MKVFLLSLLFYTTTLLALEVPTLTGPVVDEAQFLRRDTHRSIEAALINLDQQSGIQFQVLVIDKLVDETIETYSIKVVDEWKLGKKGADKAALFIMALEDKKMRIEVGRGLEGELTDLVTRRILEEVKPFFRKGDFDSGVVLGLTLMGKTIGKELNFTGIKKVRHHRKGSSPGIVFVLFLIIAIFQIFSPRRQGIYSGGRGGFGGFGGGSGGGFGGGGWSGGGGGFSGGGSSSSW